MADALSRLSNQIERVGIFDQTCDAHMFTLQHEWLLNVYDYLLEGMMPKRFTTSQRQYLAQKAKPFVLQEGVLYIFGQDNKFCQVLQPKKVPTILQELHGGVARRHFSSNVTMTQILDARYQWLMMDRNVHEHCRTCDQCQKTSNMLTQNLAKLITTLP